MFLEVFIFVFCREENVWCDLFGRWIVSIWDGDFDDFKWKVLSVVVRLMGFEDLLNFDVVSNVELVIEMFFEE